MQLPFMKKYNAQPAAVFFDPAKEAKNANAIYAFS
jgi:hypothetical protein